ncbi:MAG TPA: FlgD immunoglobulin-like domain containing protein [Candidatus Acidoferrales bacterium]|nr:FlgD immunoglobulin-like domain containing protein [Candidatus Acidoferrales bacterium]
MIRHRLIALVLAGSLAATAPPSHAAGAQPSRLPDPAAIQQALDHQRADAFRLKHDAIWAEARIRLERGRELAELRQRARHGDKAARRGLHMRPARESEGAPVEEAPLAATAPPPRSAGARRALAVPVNVRCNSLTGDGVGVAQSEDYVASIRDQVVVAWNDGQGFLTNGDSQGFGWSNDGGQTFTDGGSPVHPPGLPSFKWFSDPAITVNEKTGDFFFCALVDVDASHNGIAVAHGRFTGGVFAFDSAFVVRSASNASTFLDKEWITCDSTTGDLYVVNTTFTTVDDHIDFYRSTDRGRTWSAALTLSSSADAGNVQGARVIPDGNGVVEVTWYAAQSSVQDGIRFRRSLDHGVTFQSEVTPADFNQQFGTGAPGFNRERGVNFPAIAVDRTSGPHRGRVYLAWQECWQFLDTPLPASTPNFEVENDDVAASATPFTPGQTLRGTLATRNGTMDQDWWSFHLDAQQAIVVYADSVMLGSQQANGWYLRLNDPNTSQRLCFGGDPDSTQGTGIAYYTFTAPVSGTYFLRMIAASWRTLSYDIKTAIGTPGSERGRDQRDGFVTWSDDGVTWSTPTRVNDDGIGYDLFFPEPAVGSDGAVYVTWFDHRDDLYGDRANVDATRSVDGGQTWAANQTISSAQSNFTTSHSNIAPNMGDYNGISNSGTKIYPAWGDGRDTSSVDLWSTSIDLTSALASCQGDTTMAPPGTGTFAWTIANHDVVFGGDYGVALSSARNWPLPAPANVPVPAGATALYSTSITVPDSAADGVNTLCLTLTSPAGVVVQQCCFHVTVQGVPLSVAGARPAFALAPARPNPAPGGSAIAFSLPKAGAAQLVVYDLAGARVRTLLDGARPAGSETIAWDGRDDGGRDVRPGAYFVRLQFEGRTLTERLVLMR